MAIPFLPAIDIATFDSASQGLNATALTYTGNVYAIATPEKLDSTFAYLQHTFAHFATYLDVTLLPEVQDVVSLLDAGAAKVFVSREQLLSLKSIDNIDLSRVVLSLAGQADQELDILTDTPIGIYLHGIQDASLVEVLLQQYGSKRPPVYVSLASPSVEHAIQLARIGATPILPATHLTVDTKNHPELISAADLLLANAISDRPDNLLATIVTDERGVALGLVYSSPESVAESLRTGTGVYQSRKRGLWYKGATSGDVQELVKIELDCDSDCLRFVVRQLGNGRDIASNRRQGQPLTLIQDSATSQHPPASATASTAVSPSCSKLSRAESDRLPKVHTQLAFSTTPSFSKPRSSRRPTSCAKPTPSLRLPPRLPMYCTSP